jgi:hypothetical protein
VVGLVKEACLQSFWVVWYPKRFAVKQVEGRDECGPRRSKVDVWMGYMRRNNNDNDDKREAIGLDGLDGHELEQDQELRVWGKAVILILSQLWVSEPNGSGRARAGSRL